MRNMPDNFYIDHNPNDPSHVAIARGDANQHTAAHIAMRQMARTIQYMIGTVLIPQHGFISPGLMIFAHDQDGDVIHFNPVPLGMEGTHQILQMDPAVVSSVWRQLPTAAKVLAVVPNCPEIAGKSAEELDKMRRQVEMCSIHITQARMTRVPDDASREQKERIASMLRTKDGRRPVGKEWQESNRMLRDELGGGFKTVMVLNMINRHGLQCLVTWEVECEPDNDDKVLSLGGVVSCVWSDDTDAAMSGRFVPTPADRRGAVH